MRERAELCRNRAARHRAALSGEGNGSRPGERGEDRQIGVQTNPIKATDAERSERPLVL
jgi:hypothetical protein